MRPLVLNSKKLCHITLLIVAILSFVLFSPLFSIHFNSDQAVHVLMAQKFNLETDLYYWGQNRLGSFLPLISYCINTLLNMKSIIVTSIVQYILLCSACVVFLRYINGTVLKILFIFFWFFPAPIFQEHLFIGHPYASQYFCIAMGVLFFDFFIRKKGNRFYLFMSFAFFCLSVWISELSLIFVFLSYLGFLVFFGLNLKRDIQNKQVIIKKVVTDILYVIVPIVLVYFLISYAKANSPEDAVYAKIISDFTSFKLGLFQHFYELKQIAFSPFSNFFALSYLCFFIILLILSISCIKRRFVSYNSVLQLVFFLNAFASCLSLYYLEWVKGNGFGTRYWIYSYLSFFIFVFIDEAISIRNSLQKIKLFVLTTLVSVQLIMSLQNGLDKSKTWDNEFCYQEIKKVKALGNCGIIAHYWYSYVLSSANPSDCISTPRETELNRNVWQIPQLFSQKRIFLVKNGWLERWPNSIVQYGHILKKVGTPFNISRLELCEYKENH